MTDTAPADLVEARVPPNDQQAEVGVLGAMLANHQACLAVTEILVPTDFYLPRHALIYDLLDRRVRRVEPVDVVTVVDALERTGDLARVGGSAYIHWLRNQVTAGDEHVAQAHADIVKDRATRRRLHAAGIAIQEAAATGTVDVDPAALVETARATLDTVLHRVPGVDDTDGHPWAPQDLTEILAVGDVPVPTTVLARADGACLLYPRAVHSFAGEPESGKTWIGLIGCAQTLNAGHVATYIDFEDRAGRVVPRLLSLGVAESAVAARFRYIRPTTPLDASGARRMDSACADAALVVVDGVTEAMSLHQLDVNALNDAAEFLRIIPRRIADLGPAVLQIDHLPKDADKQGRFAVGSGHKLAGLDGAAFMVKVIDPFGRGKVGRARINLSKDRHGTIREYAHGAAVAELILDATGDRLRYTLEVAAVTTTADGEWKPTRLMEKVSRFVEGMPGVSGRDIEGNVPGKGEHIRTAIRHLVAEGFLTSETGARRAVLYTSATPYRDEEAPRDF